MKVNKKVFQELGAFVLVGAAVCAVLFFSSCGSVAPVPPAAAPSVSIEPVGSASTSAESSSGAASKSLSNSSQSFSRSKQRPGLGTGWGKSIASSLANTHFERENNRPYGGVATIHYNDKEGIDAMTGRFRNKTSGFQKAANGAVEWGVKSGWGSPDHYMSGSRRFVGGKKGRNYSLVVRNVSDSRLEVVLSVDGLDVMDGKAASFKKRGYIMAPGEELKVEGFRTSYDAVAAFKFSTVDASYSNLRHGQSRDVGVIGLVVFAEKGRSLWRWSNDAVGAGNEARPFAEAPLRTVH